VRDAERLGTHTRGAFVLRLVVLVTVEQRQDQRWA
jgi:hypothetical protein